MTVGRDRAFRRMYPTPAMIIKLLIEMLMTKVDQIGKGKPPKLGICCIAGLPSVYR
jgi:hypothetical protein